MILLKEEYINALILSIKLSFFTTIILIIISIPIAYWLSQKKTFLKSIVEIFITLPLVLPPSVIGFYLLIFLNRDSILGSTWFNLTGSYLVFNFNGLLIGSVIYSLPFVVKPIQNSFEFLPKQITESAATLGARPLDSFFSVILPLTRQGVITGALLGFTHTIGEFGIVLMIGGNIPGQTKTISISIFDAVEKLNYNEANIMSCILIFISLFCIGIIYFLNKKHIFSMKF